MVVWSARSSTDSMGTSIRCTVRKAARLAVYEEMMMRVNAHLRRKRPGRHHGQGTPWEKASVFL